MKITDSTSPSCTVCGPWWRLPLLLALVLVAMLLLQRGEDQETRFEPATNREPPQPVAETSETVSLGFDFPGEAEDIQLEPVAWNEGMTVLDAMRHPSSNGPQFEMRGQDESAFLTSLGAVENEGAGGRNWTFTVNDRLGDRGFAVYELQPGDRVLWRFAAQQ